MCIHTHTHKPTVGPHPRCGTLQLVSIPATLTTLKHARQSGKGAEYSCYRQGHLCLVEALQRTFAFQSLFPTKVHCVSAELNGKSGFESLQLNDYLWFTYTAPGSPHLPFPHHPPPTCLPSPPVLALPPPSFVAVVCVLWSKSHNTHHILCVMPNLLSCTFQHMQLAC